MARRPLSPPTSDAAPTRPRWSLLGMFAVTGGCALAFAVMRLLPPLLQPVFAGLALAWGVALGWYIYWKNWYGLGTLLIVFAVWTIGLGSSTDFTRDTKIYWNTWIAAVHSGLLISFVLSLCGAVCDPRFNAPQSRR